MRTHSFTLNLMRSLSVIPAEVLERLKKEKPDTPMEDLVSEADSIVAKEIEARKAKRLEEDAKSVADSTIGKIEESPEDGEPEVSSE